MMGLSWWPVLGVLLVAVLHAEAWGNVGHELVCSIAQARLSADVNAAVLALLPPHYKDNFPGACTWPDQADHWHGWQWSACLHYVDTPDGLCGYSFGRDCKNAEGVHPMCVSGAIYNYSRQLDPTPSRFDVSGLNSGADFDWRRPDALMFLSHFVGDIHMPLHVGFTSDRGGNLIKVNWFGRERNLHEVWDDEIIYKLRDEKYGGSAKSLQDGLEDKIEGEWKQDAETWGDCPDSDLPCPDIYAMESVTLACNYAYNGAKPEGDEEEAELGDEYFQRAVPIVERQLAAAGVRLAAILNRVLGHKEVAGVAVR